MKKNTTNEKYARRGALYILPIVLIILSLACSLPSIVDRQVETTPLPPIDTATTAPTPTATSTPEPLPPTVMESEPYPAEALALNAPVRLYFNQPMDRNSVESALNVQPAQAGSFSWEDDSTLVFTPGEPYAPDSQISFEIGETARSAQGLSMPAPVSLRFSTVGYLQLAQSLPVDGGVDVDPTSAIVAAFNHPVVPLGVESDSLPAAFTIEPQPEGRGEWLNTSTYVFYPEPGMAGGLGYTVRLDASLKALDGSPLASQSDAQLPYTWSFTTAPPRLLTIQPEPDLSFVPLDREIELTFNQPMDPTSVEFNFSLAGQGGERLDGTFEWSEDFRVLTFTPDRLFARSAQYTITLSGQASSAGGTSLGADVRAVFYTVTPLSVSATTPVDGGIIAPRQNVSIYFNTPLGDRDNLKDYVSVEPEVPDLGVWYSDFDGTLNFYGNFAAETEYVLTISGDLPDPWGGSLEDDYNLRFQTGSLEPAMIVTGESDVLFLTPNDPAIYVQATNLFSLSMSQGSVPLTQFFELVGGDNAYDLRQTYTSPDQQEWVQSLDLVPNRSQEVRLNVASDGAPLPSGLYYMRFNVSDQRIYSGPYFLVVSDVHLTFKLGAEQAFVWAVNLDDGEPADGLQVTIYDKTGAALASGQTDEQGIFNAPLETLESPYDTYFAVAGEGQDSSFGLALSTWNRGTAAWYSGISVDYYGPRLKAYLYTDRPIYRPGQTVYYRGILRREFNGRYEIPDMASLPITIYGDMGEELNSFELPLSGYGTFQGEYNLADGAKPGYYRIGSPIENAEISVSFQVAEYRKPEINLEVAFDAEQSGPDVPLQAHVSARYFFDAPAGDVDLNWALYKMPAGFSLPGYQVGTADTRWLDPFYIPDYGFGGFIGTNVEQGQAKTDAQGVLDLSFDVEPEDARMRYTLEVTAMDESNLPVSGRGTVVVNPAEIFIGVRPDAWVGQAGTQTGFEVLSVDWDKNPVPGQRLRAEFSKVVWVREDQPEGSPYDWPTFRAEYTLVGSTDFETGQRGAARVAFTPPDPGTYQLDVTGNGARTEVILWVGGQGDAVWPNLPNKRLQLIADRDSYLPGDSAEIFVANPFPGTARALITFERDEVMRYEVREVASGGETMTVSLDAGDAPNVYLSVTLIYLDGSGTPDYRHGYLNVDIDPLEQVLQVSLVSQPERAGPRDSVAFEIEVRDEAGEPVQAEFSLSVVDRATLALADSNVPPINEAFYGEQPLGVRTGLPLSAYAAESSLGAPGLGGGGGGDNFSTIVREDFPDTAYWDAAIVTDQDGRARVEMVLPDNLTTWQVLVRGVDQDTRVGSFELDLVATKPLLIRPVTPRFLVVGDRLEMAAIVQNNTSDELDVNVSLDANGFSFDDLSAANKSVTVAGGGRMRLSWWGTVQNVEAVDMVFSASSGDLSDATRPTQGELPVLRYTAPQTFRTAGVLEDGGEALELISLPRSFDPSGGELKVNVAASLAGTMLDALEVLENYPYQCTEQTLSRFLPNLETYRVFQQFDIESPALESRLDRTLQDGLDELLARQNEDGGWGWWQDDPSDPYVTAYVLFGLSRAQDAGIDIHPQALASAVVYLSSTLTPPEMALEAWQLDRQVFIHFALYEAGAGDRAGVDALYLSRERLNPDAKALLALLLADLSQDGERARSMLSDLEATAIRSAAGAHWETTYPSPQNMSSPVSTTAMVVYVLAQRNPGSPVLTDAVRYLAAHREQGGWGSTYATAWTLMAFSETLKGTGELGGDFEFSAALNDAVLVDGVAGENGAATTAEVPIEDLRADMPNALTIRRDPGLGRLYYDAALSLLRPVEQVEPLSRGIDVSRAYYPLGVSCPEGKCAPVREAPVRQLVQVNLTLTLEQAAYYLLVEDYIPAGAEVLDTSLKTTQQALPELQPPEASEPEPLYSAARPFQDGWGWWLFGDPDVYDERIAWAANFLPAGTYQLTYTLVLNQPGEYRVLPARAWQFYFPEVQGNSAGSTFEIRAGE